MKPSEDPLSPPRDVFVEAWHAQTLAAAAGCVEAGHFTAAAWSDALGAALQAAAVDGLPDTEETYYLSALTALESLIPLQLNDLLQRKEDWRQAYLRTPHGAPVEL